MRVCIVLFACYIYAISNSVMSAEMDGRLLFGWKGSLTVLDLKTLETEPLFAEGGMSPELAVLDSEHIVYESQIGQLSLLNLSTRKKSYFLSGSNPYYLPDHELIFFLAADNNSVGPGLYIAEIANPRETTQLIDSGRYIDGVNIIQISSDDVVVTGYGAAKPFLYNILKRTKAPLSLPKGCIPMEWRDHSKQLICSSREEGVILLTDLSGVNVQSIDSLSSVFPILYLNESDTLIYSKSAKRWLPPERIDLYAYDFDKQVSRLLIKGVPIFRGHAVLLPVRKE